MGKAATPKKKRLMLIVHGLGEQGPGETLDDLAGGLWGGDDNVCVEADNRLLQEDHQEDETKLRTFPCHVRRYSDPASDDGPHTTFAEVYWADLSAADQGTFRTFYGLIKTILGLGHIVRAAAKEYFGEDSLSAKMANFVAYMMHGPVAAVNVALAVGVLFLFASTQILERYKFEWLVDATLLLAGLALCFYGASQRKHKFYYFRIFSTWVAIFGVVLMVLAVLEVFDWNFDPLKRQLSQVLLGNEAGDQDALISGSAWYGVALLLCLKIAWLVSVAAIVWTCVATCLKRTRFTRGEEGAVLLTPLPLILVCAMSWLWMLVISTIWVTAGEYEKIKKLLHADLLHNGVQLLVIALAGVAVVFAGAAITLAYRGWWRRQFKEKSGTTNEVFAKHQVPRLLLSAPLVIGIVFAGLSLAFAALLVLGQFVFWSLGWEIPPTEVQKWVTDSLSGAVLVAIAIGGLAVSQREGIAQALGIGKDLVTYFKVEPVQRKVVHPGTGPRMMNAFSSPGKFEFSDFQQRDRIHARMQRVLNAFWQDDFEELIVISHSQGTIIATEFAKELQDSDSEVLTDTVRNRFGPIMKEATLVTMGSPFTHVYNHYLPSTFKTPDSVVQGTMLKTWINIFRVDDFIGTYIGKKDLSEEWPKNQAVPQGGHTGYWKDANVIAHIKPLLT